MRTYRLQLDRELGAPTLPGSTALLKEQRAAVRALRILYPDLEVKLFSKIKLDGEREEEREIKV